MNICFQAIFNKTIFFYAVAKKLEASGHEIFWTSTSRKWTDWLIAKGTPPSRILLLQRDRLNVVNGSDADDDTLVRRIETEYGLKLKKLYFMDRILSTWPWEEAYRYMAGVVQELDRFVLINEIEVMLGESTSSDEILSAAVCKLRGRAFYHPGTARIPSDRFLFFMDHLQEAHESFGGEAISEPILEEADKIRAAILSGAKPNYWYWNNKVPGLNTGFVHKIWSKIREALVESRTDATVKSLRYHLTRQRQYLKPLRYFSLRIRSVFQQPVAGEKFVLYTLHKQPEASIDVFGADYSDQPHVIKQIVRQLPAGTWLYVKEHSNSIGDRTRKELDKIANLPGVRLIDPFYETHDLIRGSEAVITITGTVAFEAALLGKPAGTFSRMYFSKFSSLRHLTNWSDIAQLLNDRGGWTEGDRRTLARIIMNSFEGIIGDPLSAPVCMIEENLTRVANGIEQLCKVVSARRPKAPPHKPCVTIVCDSHGAGYGTIGFAELATKKLSPNWRVASYAYGGLPVREIYEELCDERMPDSEVAIIQVGNPDVHPRMPIGLLRTMRSLGMTFCRDSLFSIPPRPSLRYFLRFPLFLVRLVVLRFHQEFLVETDELQKDFDRLVALVSRRAKRVIIMPIFAVHPRIYTDSHRRRAETVNSYLAEKYPHMCVTPRLLRPSTYRRYYNRDGFHFIQRYHELICGWLVRVSVHQKLQRKGLVLKRTVAESHISVGETSQERVTVA